MGEFTTGPISAASGPHVQPDGYRPLAFEP